MFAISTSWMVTASIKLEATFFKSFSLFDKRGDIYAFRIVDDEDPQYLFKVGRTSRPLEERMIEWDRQCPSKVHIWHEGILVAHSHRVERLVHLELMARGYERVIEMCPDCGKKHQEIFRLPSPDAWETVIKPLIHEVNGRVER
ncbi:hypothetical protein WG66_005675 [Moniliophthora roreri]|nr:hypothetical protein WG66_000347 [Moniliophthora roreri]KAI3602539.1 hypothetical protein WG66_009210 [Moniliophthora roreri]KAI3605700.1 hypothetical protein WG66_012046 [Moniliophthora roreri]KAI3614513.1 hypothetical protein WG66_009638 [Moniliophthora roreri]KAI3618080.1 hypothetical protein WG66_005675 [Moniliophthora roreri]